MKSSNLLTKILAISGTILVGLPVVAPIMFSLIRLIQSGRFMFDYLMPAELGFLVLGGAALLLWAAFRARTRIKLILWAAIAAVVTVVGGQLLAVVTGLADGSASQSSPWMVAVLSLIVAYDLLVLLLFIAGCLLCRDVFAKSKGSVTIQ
jgi:hypothetical protein